MLGLEPAGCAAAGGAPPPLPLPLPAAGCINPPPEGVLRCSPGPPTKLKSFGEAMAWGWQSERSEIGFLKRHAAVRVC
jgi:hypothetical protein